MTSKRVFGNDSIPGCSALSIVADYIEPAPTIIQEDVPVMYYPQVDGVTPTIIQADPPKEET